MTETTYSYLYSDFYENVNTTQLQSDITAAMDETWPSLIEVIVDWNASPTEVDVTFSDALSELQHTELDAVVASYIASIQVYGEIYMQGGLLHFDDGLGHIYSFTPNS